MEKVKVGLETCNECVYHGYNTSILGLCSYMLIEKHSRIFENGKRTVEKGYCNKFISCKNNEELRRVCEEKVKNINRLRR